MFGPTADHEEIRTWALRHNAHPAQKRAFKFDSEPALLHFIFGKDVESEEIHRIAWDAFFAQFDLMHLKLVFDESPQFELLQEESSSIYRKSAQGLN